MMEFEFVSSSLSQTGFQALSDDRVDAEDAALEERERESLSERLIHPEPSRRQHVPMTRVSFFPLRIVAPF